MRTVSIVLIWLNVVCVVANVLCFIILGNTSNLIMAFTNTGFACLLFCTLPKSEVRK